MLIEGGSYRLVSTAVLWNQHRKVILLTGQFLWAFIDSWWVQLGRRQKSKVCIHSMKDNFICLPITLDNKHCSNYLPSVHRTTKQRCYWWRWRSDPKLGPVLDWVALHLNKQVHSLRVLLDPDFLLDKQVVVAARGTFHLLWLVSQLWAFVSRTDLATSRWRLLCLACVPSLAFICPPPC